MKQHITVEQLNQLSEKGKEKLREWWKLKEGDLVVIDGWNDDQEPQLLLEGFYADGEYDYSNGLNLKDSLIGYTLPLLSIGQMIEFLDEQHDIEISRESLREYLSPKGRKSWVVNIKGDVDYSYQREELADALWEAVKEVLNET